MIARINPDGTLDTTFGSNSQGIEVIAPFGPFSTDDGAWAVAVDDQNRIVVAGYTAANTFSGPGPDVFALARLNADGSLDFSFGNGGAVTTSFGTGGDQARGGRNRARRGRD